MLIEFSVKNYLCFKDKVTLSMVASPDTEHPEHTFSADCFPEKLLKTCVIYGANASGKSNLFKAMGFMRTLVISSSKESQVNERIDVTPFRLSTETYNEPSEFEIVFICEGTRYRYGFAVDRDKIHSEWLYHVPKKREALLFERKGNEYKLSGIFKEGKGLKEKTRENALFLSVCAQFNGEISKKIMKWVRRLGIISGIHGLTPVTIEMMKGKHSDEIRKLMKCADFGIADMEVKEDVIENLASESSLLELLINKQGMAGKIDGEKIVSIDIQYHHNKFDKDNKKISTETFLSNEESQGTNKFFSLIGPVIDTLADNDILVIDELDSSLHIHLFMEILRMFHSRNNKSAQLIFNCHNPGLLSNKIFRRDEIYFIEKDCYGASDLYSLYDFREKARKDASFGKNYLLGKYGAVPQLGDFEELLLFPEDK